MLLILGGFQIFRYSNDNIHSFFGEKLNNTLFIEFQSVMLIQFLFIFSRELFVFWVRQLHREGVVDFIDGGAYVDASSELVDELQSIVEDGSK